MSKRNKPRKSKSQRIKTVLQALDGDTAELDKLVLSLSPGNGVGVKAGNLAKYTFIPNRPPRPGKSVNWKEQNA